MTVLDERPQPQLSDAGPVLATAQGTADFFCHIWPSTYTAKCKAAIVVQPTLFHEAGPCPNGHPLCPDCYS